MSYNGYYRNEWQYLIMLWASGYRDPHYLILLFLHSSYYKYPLSLSTLFESKDLKRCVLGESISQNIQLIITSSHGEHRYNERFGCKIWDMDFELVMSQRMWEEKLRQSLLLGITEFERRIEQAQIEVKISEVEDFQPIRKYLAIKRKVDILVKAVIVETGEKYNFHTDLFLSPVTQY